MLTQFTPVSVPTLVKNLKASSEDFEYYPTTDEIISVIRRDILSTCGRNHRYRKHTFLDVGAGNGQTMMKITAELSSEEKSAYYLFDGFSDLYAIEKSTMLASQLNSDVMIIGTDFFNQSLLDKNVDIAFSNPPFEVFEQWAAKLLTESCARVNYLVLPVRWENSELIKAAIAKRSYDFEILGTFDFGKAERATRHAADVHVIRFYQSSVDAFGSWFDEMFDLNFEQDKRKFESVDSACEQLVPGTDLVIALEAIYNTEVERLFKLFKSLEVIEADTLLELGVSKSSIVTTLKMKIEGLKKHFWKRLFDNLSVITDRLIASERTRILDRLNQHLSVDFSAANAYAIVTWLINNASPTLSEQFVNVFESMISADNLLAYKSNRRTFKAENWRYRCPRDNIKYHSLERFKLDYRCVISGHGGLGTNYGYTYGSGLSERAADFINDLLVIAQSVGFDTKTSRKAHEYKWESNKGNIFKYLDANEGSKTLMEIKAFKNGNMHIRFAPDFIMKMNVKFGQLKGWVKSAEEAADELNIPLNKASDFFAHDLVSILPPPSSRLLIAA